jgi:hypothetical protein
MTEDDRSPMFMDWYSQYCENGYITKSNLHGQHNSHQNPNDIHNKDWKINPIVHLEAQKTMNSKDNTEQKEHQHWRYHNMWLQTILQSHSNTNSMVLTPKQIWRPVEQNKRPRYESTHPHPPSFWQMCQKHRIAKMLLGKLGNCLRKLKLGHPVNSKWSRNLIYDMEPWSYYRIEQGIH